MLLIEYNGCDALISFKLLENFFKNFFTNRFLIKVSYYLSHSSFVIYKWKKFNFKMEIL